MKDNLPPLVNTSIAGFDFISQPTCQRQEELGFILEIVYLIPKEMNFAVLNQNLSHSGLRLHINIILSVVSFTDIQMVT